MSEAVLRTKDPLKVRAGQMGAVKRWGDEPRVLRLDQLPDAKRRIILALVELGEPERESVHDAAA